MGSLNRRVVALERSAAHRAPTQIDRPTCDDLDDGEIDRRIGILENLAKQMAAIELHGAPLTPERERALRDAEMAIDWSRPSVPRVPEMSDDEIKAAIRAKLRDLEAGWQAA